MIFDFSSPLPTLSSVRSGGGASFSYSLIFEGGLGMGMVRLDYIESVEGPEETLRIDESTLILSDKAASPTSYAVI